MKRYFIKDIQGEFRLEIGDTDSITFGPSIPFPSRLIGRDPARGLNPPQTFGGSQVYAIRIYGSDKRLKGVFTGVYEVREESIRATRMVDGTIDGIPVPAPEPGDGVEPEQTEFPWNKTPGAYIPKETL